MDILRKRKKLLSERVILLDARKRLLKNIRANREELEGIDRHILHNTEW